MQDIKIACFQSKLTRMINFFVLWRQHRASASPKPVEKEKERQSEREEIFKQGESVILFSTTYIIWTKLLFVTFVDYLMQKRQRYSWFSEIDRHFDTRPGKITKNNKAYNVRQYNLNLNKHAKYDKLIQYLKVLQRDTTL
jgi:hypothetical protein